MGKDGDPGVAVAYVAVSLAAGLFIAAAATVIARRRHSGRPPGWRRSESPYSAPAPPAPMPASILPGPFTSRYPSDFPSAPYR